jgi:hypothetical protein
LYVGQAYSKSIDAFRRISEPTPFDHPYLAAAHIESADTGAANEHVPAMLALKPELTIAYFRHTHPYQLHKDLGVFQGFLDALGRTNLPAGQRPSSTSIRGSQPGVPSP